jgi:hypothetical protein
MDASNAAHIMQIPDFNTMLFLINASVFFIPFFSGKQKKSAVYPQIS